MKLTREHYEVFASIFGTHWHQLPPEFINEFVHYLSENNPKFDKKIFAKAVRRAIFANKDFDTFMTTVLTPVHIENL